MSSSSTELPRASAARPFAPPRITRFVRFLIRYLGRMYLRAVMGVSRVETSGLQTLRDALTKHYDGQAHLLIAFRHVDLADGPVMLHLAANIAPTPALKRFAPHTYFLYGKDVLNWAGTLARFTFPRAGGIPVVNAHQDRLSLETVRRVLTTGRHPLAFAPEGQVTYRMFQVSPITSGVGTFAWWSRQRPATDLELPVLIVPVAIAYHQGKRQAAALRSACKELLEITNDAGNTPESEKAITEFLMTKTSDVFSLIDQELSAAGSAGRGHLRLVNGSSDRIAVGATDLHKERDRLWDSLLSRGERLLGLEPASDPLERLFRLRYASLRRIYREDGDPAAFNDAKRAAADTEAVAGALANRYQQIADILMYIEPRTIEPETPSLVLSEYAHNVIDLVNRIAGGSIETRRKPKNRTAVLRVGSPVQAESDADTDKHRRSFVARVKEEVQHALETVTGELRDELLGDRWGDPSATAGRDHTDASRSK